VDLRPTRGPARRASDFGQKLAVAASLGRRKRGSQRVLGLVWRKCSFRAAWDRCPVGRPLRATGRFLIGARAGPCRGRPLRKALGNRGAGTWSRTSGVSPKGGPARRLTTTGAGQKTPGAKLGLGAGGRRLGWDGTPILRISVRGRRILSRDRLFCRARFGRRPKAGLPTGDPGAGSRLRDSSTSEGSGIDDHDLSGGGEEE